MTLWLAIVLVLAGSAAVVVAMALLRRRAPRGGWFADSDRASGLLGVLGASFAILLGLVVLFAAENYSDARRHAADEASAVKDMFDGAGLLPGGSLVRRDLVCYARAVSADEWRLMEHDRRSPRVEHWAAVTERGIDHASVAGERQSAGLQTVLAARSARDTARRERLASAVAVIPLELWIALVLAGVVLVGFVLLYADAAERGFVQLLATGSVTLLVGSTLMAVVLLSHPFSGHSGAIGPSDMRYSQRLMETALQGADVPCNAVGERV